MEDRDDEKERPVGPSRLSPEEERARQAQFHQQKGGLDSESQNEADEDGGSQADEKAEPDEEKQQETQEAEPVDVTEISENWLEGFFARMNYEIDFEIEKDDDQLDIDLGGEDAEILLGRGERSPKVVESIETLLSATVARRSEPHDVFMDVFGFRREREKRLKGLAKELARIAEKRNEPVTVAGVDRYERRIIHETLRGSDSVETDSVGPGAFRKVQVFPDN